ncbi:histone-like nucleoid-structuring protein Lsr2 [Varibaculum vaginae]|uniref:histone-like nucleoid-structuring protein Lsr2 n=1 Tax=Varibaculum vaginae TaxID=2364797 RepID=UPI000F0842D0|nr:Lsr2 family protein [Varibaculum vaginae]
MARKTRIVLIDDINGELGDETVKFGLDGVDYEIDLTTENAAKLREVLEPWIQGGRRVGGRRVAGTDTRATSDAAKIRTWAQEQNMQVSEKGRISAKVRTAYYRTHLK